MRGRLGHLQIKKKIFYNAEKVNIPVDTLLTRIDLPTILTSITFDQLASKIGFWGH